MTNTLVASSLDDEVIDRSDTSTVSLREGVVTILSFTPEALSELNDC